MNFNVTNCCSNLIRDRSPSSKFRKNQFNRIGTVSLPDELSNSNSSLSSSGSSNVTTDSELNDSIGVIEPSELAEKLEDLENNSIVFDLRSAASYCRIHIVNATLVNCSSKLKARRAIQIVTDVIKTSPNLCEIILYTENGNPIKNDDHIIALLHFLLSNQITCLFLKGGIKKFESIYSNYCESGSSNSICLPAPKYMTEIRDIFYTKPSQIMPFLYLGNEFDAQNLIFLNSNKITHILNLTLVNRSNVLDLTKFKYKQLDCSDNHLQDLSQIFPEAFKFIESARLSNGKILVHCQAGVSRSASVVIAYLMSHSTCQLDLNAAHQLVKKRRPIISPNFNFMGQLVQFESDLMMGCIKSSRVLQIDVTTYS